MVLELMKFLSVDVVFKNKLRCRFYKYQIKNSMNQYLDYSLGSKDIAFNQI